MQEMNRTIVTQKEEKQAVQDQQGKATEKYQKPEPKVKMNLKYKPMEHITNVGNFYVEIPKCYNDALNFNWNECDYQIQYRDQKYLKELNSQIRDTPDGPMITIEVPPRHPYDVKQHPLSEEEFEKVIDILDKAYQITRSKNLDALS